MSKQSRDRGAVSGVAVAARSQILGAGAAGAAGVAVVTSAAPDDSRAVQTGPATPVDPTAVIHYGG